MQEKGGSPFTRPMMRVFAGASRLGMPRNTSSFSVECTAVGSCGGAALHVHGVPGDFPF